MYNRTKIQNLDPRQLIYLSYHTEEAGTEALVINGKDYLDRVKEHGRPSIEELNEICNRYPDRELYLDCNLRGWAIVIRNESNETMYNWPNLAKIQ